MSKNICQVFSSAGEGNILEGAVEYVRLQRKGRTNDLKSAGQELKTRCQLQQIQDFLSRVKKDF